MAQPAISRPAVFLALALGAAAPVSAGAAALSPDFSDLPDLPTTLAERAARAIYPGPVQWVFGAPATASRGFAGFLMRLRSFLAEDAAASRPRIAALVSPERESPAEDAAKQGEDAPLPVSIAKSAERQDVIDIFLGVDLELFLHRLFSAVVKVNGDAVWEREERRREAWRTAYLGAGGGSMSSSRSRGFLTGYDASSYGGYGFSSPYGGGFAAAGSRSGGLVPAGRDPSFDERSLLVEVREKVLDFLFSPLLVIGLFMAMLVSLLWNIRSRIAAEWRKVADGRPPFHSAGAAGPEPDGRDAPRPG